MDDRVRTCLVRPPVLNNTCFVTDTASTASLSRRKSAPRLSLCYWSDLEILRLPRLVNLILEDQSPSICCTPFMHSPPLLWRTDNIFIKISTRASGPITTVCLITEFLVTGDQAEIVFTLIGTPPFTFTYQRSELRDAKDHRPANVLETHTVSHLTTNSFAISASIEGMC